MANIHYAQIGDIWKHLPLAEILGWEQPRHYWESHAGNACYPLKHSQARDFGIYHFMEHASQSTSLNASLYKRIVHDCAGMTPIGIYPGSPLIAMTVLGSLDSDFIFCDTDAASIANVTEIATHLGLSEKHRVHAVHRDGITTLQRAFEGLSPLERSRTLVFFDPYDPLDQSESTNALDLFCQFTLAGIKTLLWFGLSSRALGPDILRTIHKTLENNQVNPKALWLGWIALDHKEDISHGFNPGVWGCGLLCGNISDQSLHICKQLGNGLKQIYASAVMPDGNSGAIRFSAGRTIL